MKSSQSFLLGGLVGVVLRGEGGSPLSGPQSRQLLGSLGPAGSAGWRGEEGVERPPPPWPLFKCFSSPSAWERSSDLQSLVLPGTPKPNMPDSQGSVQGFGGGRPEGAPEVGEWGVFTQIPFQP